MSDKGQTRRILEIISLTEEYFAKKGVESARVDAEILMGHILQCKRFELYMRHDQPLKAHELDSYRELAKKRASGVPVQHLTGEQDFYALKLQVSEKTLIPRPETEILVESIFNTIAKEKNPANLKVLELGTGTGAISIALANGWPNAEIWAVDLSLDALDVARGNVNYHGLSERIHLLHGDLFEPVENDGLEFDLIVSNPPYIPSAEISTLSTEVKDHEPHLALNGGNDGLDIIRKIVNQSAKYLKNNSWVFLEIGDGQGESTLEILNSAEIFDNSQILPDLSGRERIASAKRSA